MSALPIIRDAVSGDIPAIASIYAVHVREGLGTFELHPPSADEMRQREFGQNSLFFRLTLHYALSGDRLLHRQID